VFINRCDVGSGWVKIKTAWIPACAGTTGVGRYTWTGNL